MGEPNLAVWLAPPPIFGPHVRAWATGDLAPPPPSEAPPEHAALRSPRRIGEFAAGRRCAARALHEAGADDVVVGVGEGREPLWPSGFVGSITHTADRACAAVASKLHLRSIGIDFERIFDDEALRDAAPQTLLERERSLGGPWTEKERATIVFSAKESLYKCLYPLARLFFDFTEAEVERIAPSGTFQLRLLRDLGDAFARGSEFEGRFAVVDGHVHTALELRT